MRANERSMALIDAGVDLVVIDTAHGHSEGVAKAVARIKAEMRPMRGSSRGMWQTATADARTDRRRCRCREGGHWPRFHLHHAGLWPVLVCRN